VDWGFRVPLQVGLPEDAGIFSHHGNWVKKYFTQEVEIASLVLGIGTVSYLPYDQADIEPTQS
jgi:hypothetical protein